MNTDFLELYQSYSNIELLKIIKRPDQYQPQAVNVAIQILDNREVTEQEQQAADEYFREMDRSKQLRQDKVASVRKTLTSFLSSLNVFDKNATTQNWINLLVTFTALEYIYTVVQTTMTVINTFYCPSCLLYIMFPKKILYLTVVPFVFVFLAERKQIAWSLLFGLKIYTLATSLVTLYSFLHMTALPFKTLVFLFLVPLISAAYLILLWQKPVRTIFTVTFETSVQTLVLSLAIMVVVEIAAYYMFLVITRVFQINGLLFLPLMPS